MGSSRPHVVFVDDDPWEVETFRRLYEGDRFRITAIESRRNSTVIARIRDEVRDVPIDLFVLDLFFSEVEAPPDQTPGEVQEIASRAAEEIAVRARGLESYYRGDPAQLLREAHAVMYRSGMLLDSLCVALRQSPAGGIALLRQLDAEYPQTPKVFYSRKATLADAKRVLEAGALDVLSKPDPGVEQQEARAIMDQFEQFCDGRAPTWSRAWLGRSLKYIREWGPLG